MRAAGMTLAQIGERLGVCAARARQIVQKAQRFESNPHGNKSPLERWLEAEVIVFPELRYEDPTGRKAAKRALKIMEGWTGRIAVPRCSKRERDTWETYYATRAAAP